MYFLGFSMTYILMAWSIYLPYRVKHLHFLAVATMAVTSYMGGILSVNFGWSFLPTLLLSIVIGALISYLISHTIGNAPTFTVVIVGITFVFIIKTAIENTDYLGGTIGLFGIPVLDHPLIILFAFLLVIGYFLYRIDHSRIGRAASVIFTDENLAKSMGIKPKQIGMLFQTISGGIAGSAGVFYAFFVGSLFPDFFTFHLIGTLMTILFIGGYTTMWGVIPAALILRGVPMILPSSIASWRLLIYGVLLVAIIATKPKGLITKKMLWELLKKRSGS